LHAGLALLAAVAILSALSLKGDDASLQTAAEQLAKKFLIIDSHIDYPEMYRKEDDPTKRVYGDFDFPRAVKGGLKAAFMAIYVPPGDEVKGIAQQTADTRIKMVESLAERWPEICALARTPAEIRKNAAAGKISLPMGMENGTPIEEDLANLARYYDRGIRYLTLCHMKNNQICDSSTDYAPTWNGLSPFGRKVVPEMNRLGMMIDVSHVSDETFTQVLALSKAPVIASHSSCRVFNSSKTFGYKRNLSDDMIMALAKNGGVIQINFGSEFLDDGYRETGEVASVVQVAAHINHAVKIAGVDHVGIGSDFDGIGNSEPSDLKDVSCYPNLIRELLKLGYSPEDIEKICGENLLRVWSEVERVAKELQANPSPG
jgi:membrane dipeptidase